MATLRCLSTEARPLTLLAKRSPFPFQRHFIPLITLRALIDSMVYVKLNTLHWHIYDFESFPLESIALPRLWEAAFSVDERYTRAAVRDIVEYARLRSVRVLVELDLPGHAS